MSPCQELSWHSTLGFVWIIQRNRWLQIRLYCSLMSLRLDSTLTWLRISWWHWNQWLQRVGQSSAPYISLHRKYSNCSIGLCFFCNQLYNYCWILQDKVSTNLNSQHCWKCDIVTNFWHVDWIRRRQRSFSISHIIWTVVYCTAACCLDELYVCIKLLLL